MKLHWPAITVLTSVVTFIAGVGATALWQGRAISTQELATAVQVLGAPQMKDTDGARQWAQGVLSRYRALQQSDVPDVSLLALQSQDADFKKNICIFSLSEFPPPPKPRIAASSTEEAVAEWRKGASKAMASAVYDYRVLRSQYDVVMDILGQTCGFLNKPSPAAN